MDIADSFGAPIVEDIGDEKQSFPMLTMDDLAEIASEIKSERRESARSRADECSLNSVEKYRALQEADEREANLFDVMDRIESPKGTKRVLELSLKRCEKDKTAIDSILQKLDPVRQLTLAKRLTGLFKTKPPKAQQQELTAPDGGPVGFGENAPAERPLQASPGFGR